MVDGQRMMQAASDVFLGWARGGPDSGQDFYLRQLRDMKGSAEIEFMSARELEVYAALCGAALARATHARDKRRRSPGISARATSSIAQSRGSRPTTPSRPSATIKRSPKRSPRSGSRCREALGLKARDVPVRRRQEAARHREGVCRDRSSAPRHPRAAGPRHRVRGPDSRRRRGPFICWPSLAFSSLRC